MNHYVLMALIATLGTWFVTALGAATVIFFKNHNRKLQNVMLGFASGVMIAASFWSLLQPAIDRANEISHIPAYAVVAVGFLCGALFIWIADKTVSLLRQAGNAQYNMQRSLRRSTMLMLSVTIHNIPEGLAVGVAFGALKDSGCTTQSLMSAICVAVGIALQNFPEGAAVSVPMRREGNSRWKSFLYGQASGMVEPVAGVLGALLVGLVEAMLPYALAFAAGAMILVATHELIPECQENKEQHPYLASTGIILGFAVMMLLDVMLG